MNTVGDPSSPYFYLHLPVIHELEVLVPFTLFEVDFLIPVNVAPSHITPNVWSILTDFHIICYSLGVLPTIFLPFFRINLIKPFIRI